MTIPSTNAPANIPGEFTFLPVVDHNQDVADVVEIVAPGGATIFNQLGIKSDTEIQSPTGRPIQLFREGKVVEKQIG